jgi:acyl-CoA thioester hydrolase
MRGPESGWLEGTTHHLPVRVYYEDTDFTGVVYHGTYVRYCERGRSEFLRVAGVSHAELMGEDATAFTVTRMTLEFLKAARIDDALLVSTFLPKATGARLWFDQQIRRGDELIFRAEVEAACIDAAGRARRPPKRLVEIVRPLVSAGAP